MRATRSILTSLLAAAAAAAAPAVVDAAEPKVLVLPYQHMNKGMPDDLGEQTTVVVTREMAAQGLAVVRADDIGASGPSEPAPSRNPDAPTGDPKAQAKASRYIEKARDAMDDADFGRATRYLSKAAKEMEQNADAVPDLRLLSEIYLQAGVAYFRDGMEDEGDDMLTKSVHLDPERKLDAADYPPIFIKVHERARFNVLRRPRGRVEVKAQPGATVLFDGRNLGKAPMVLTDVLPGRHWIRVERPGEGVQAKAIRARGRKTLVVEFAGAESDDAPAAPAAGVLGALQGNQVGKSHVEALTKAGRKAGADFVMVGGIYKTDTAYQIRTAYVQVASGEIGPLTEIAFDLDMLSAEIEVFKLAEDAKNQAEAGALTTPTTERPFRLARKLKPPRRRRIARPGEGETKLTTVVAAPPPLKKPTTIYAEPSRGPVAAAAEPTPETKRPARPPPTLVPKDEVGTAAAPPPSSPALTAGAMVPKDEVDDDDDGGLWWLWIIAGAAVVGGATAGGVLLAGSGGSDQANLQISW